MGLRLARFWAGRGHSVWVTSRSTSRVEEFQQGGLQGLLLDVTDVKQATLPEVDTIVFAVGYDRSSSHGIDEVYVDGLRHVLDRVVDRSLKHFIYLSSTGVYGDHEGGWVDERTPCAPIRAGGKACWQAEQLLQTHPATADRHVVLRLAGIYGPDRLLQIAKLRAGEPLAVVPEAFLNLIHVDDVVRVVDRVVAEDVPLPSTLCVSDGQPVRRGDFYRHLATLAELPPPTFQPPPPDSPQAARARGDKRIRNDRLLSLCDFQLRFPSYREGLADLLDRDRDLARE